MLLIATRTVQRKSHDILQGKLIFTALISASVISTSDYSSKRIAHHKENHGRPQKKKQAANSCLSSVFLERKKRKLIKSVFLRYFNYVC